MLTHDAIHEFFQSIKAPKKILVAFSGGLDSHVLLHLVSQLSDYQVRAAHIHHGLLDMADVWPLHCEKVCSNLEVPLLVKYLSLEVKKGDSIEEVARIARYKALKGLQQGDELLVTAHHQNDQTETLLLQLFRGAGVNGLAAMPSFSVSNCHARPLLSENRRSLESYSKAHQLKYIEDPSNQDNIFDRNFLRNEVLPKIRKRWNGLDKAVGRSAGIQAETKHLLDEFAEIDLQSMVFNDNTININELCKLSILRQKLLIRYWINESSFSTPSEKKLAHIFSDVINASEDAQPLVKWQGAECRRFQNKLYIIEPLSAHDSSQELIWCIEQPLMIESLGVNLIFSSLDLDKIMSEKDTVSVSFRQGGEKMYVANRGAHISLKNLMQEQNVPPWLRSRLPLIKVNNEIVKVVGLK